MSLAISFLFISFHSIPVKIFFISGGCEENLRRKMIGTFDLSMQKALIDRLLFRFQICFAIFSKILIHWHRLLAFPGFVLVST